MKKIVFAALSMLLFVGCSNDDTNNGSSSGAIYLPLSAGNYWNYDVDAAASGRDSLYVANDTLISGQNFKRMETRELPFGFYSGALRNNGVQNENGAILVSGNAGLNLGDAFPIELALTNFILLKENASPNQLLSTLTGEIERDFDGFPLTISYSLKSTAKQSLASYTTPNETYQDVKSVQLALNLQISTTMVVFGFPVTVPVLASQDVVLSTLYFAKDKGMIYANTVVSYELEDFSQAGITLPIPQSYSETQVEVLDTYSVN